jgi:tRNA pseudouridine38-40 synthase
MHRPTDPPTPSPTPEKPAETTRDGMSDSARDGVNDRVAAQPGDPGTGVGAAGVLRHGVLLEVAYDGTAYHGWAAQKNARAVEETLLGAVTALDPRVRSLRGASRTDAGVHAEGQLVAFDTSRAIPARGWVLGLNQHLPDDVAVRASRPVAVGYSPRFAARGKRYRYRVLVDAVRDPIWRTRAWRVSEVDVAAMAREAEDAKGTHDFVAFRSSGDERDHTVRTLSRIDVEHDANSRLVSVIVEGNAFLYNMVRILVGTMIDVGRGRLEPGAVGRALESRDRRRAGTTAPAHGLVLERVEVDLPDGEADRWPP